MTQLQQLDQRAVTIHNLFKLNRDRMLRGAPKTTADPSRLLAIAFNSVAYNSDLIECSKESIIGGVFEAVKLGIMLGGPMQEGWLIPFKTKGVLTATLIVGYQGYQNIISRGRAVLDMHPRAVHVEDEFDYWFGDQPRIIHKPKAAAPKDKSELRGVYVVANLRGGGRQMEVLELAEIEQHRNRSRTKDSGPWVTDYVAMALKTGVRKMAKYVPKSSELLARALDLDEKADRGVPQEFDVEGLVIPPEDGAPAPVTSSRLAALTEELTGKPAAPANPGAEEIKW